MAHNVSHHHGLFIGGSHQDQVSEHFCYLDRDFRQVSLLLCKWLSNISRMSQCRQSDIRPPLAPEKLYATGSGQQWLGGTLVPA
jgi:hypothetical protein